MASISNSGGGATGESSAPLLGSASVELRAAPAPRASGRGAPPARAIEFLGRMVSRSSVRGGRSVSRGASTASATTQLLHEYAAVSPADLAGLQELVPDAEVRELQATVQDARWTQALAWVRSKGWSREQVAAVLQRGAASFGFWALDDATLAPLVAAVASPEDGDAMRRAVDRLQEYAWPRGRAAGVLSPTARVRSATGGSAMRLLSRRDRLAAHWCFRKNPWLVEMSVVVLLAWAALVTYALVRGDPGFWTPLLDVFGWPLMVARVTALAVLGATSLLFMTMSGMWMTQLRRSVSLDARRRCCFSWCCLCIPICVPNACCSKTSRGVTRWFSTNRRELHIATAISIMVIAVGHTAAHLLSDIPVIQTASESNVTALDEVLRCGACDESAVCSALLPRTLVSPPCPFVEETDYQSLLSSTTGITGMLLWSCILLMWALSRGKARHKHFNVFYYSHNVLMWVWLALLWLHASNQWLGMGLPLAAVVCLAPALRYVWERCVRTCTARYVTPTGVVFRVPAGADEPTPHHPLVMRGEMMRISVAAPQAFLTTYRPGMYAILNVSAISRAEWHPFTVCSVPTSAGSEEEDDGSATIDFLISATGDWTSKLIGMCKDARRAAEERGAAQSAAITRQTSAYRFGRERSASTVQMLPAQPAGGVDGAGKGGVAPGLAGEAFDGGVVGIPAIAIDGPFAAPAMAALEHPLLVVVGAGVGVTPFLSLLEALVAQVEEEVGGLDGTRARSSSAARWDASSVWNSDALFGGRVCAHFFWMTRHADDFLLAWPVLNKVMANPRIRERVVVHLHVTHTAPESDAAAYLFREAVARSGHVIRSQQVGEVPETRLPVPRDYATLLCALDTRVGLPIRLGRPNLARELMDVGRQFPDDDVRVYTCGSAALVDSLRMACKRCTAAATAEGREQLFKHKHERFN